MNKRLLIALTLLGALGTGISLQAQASQGITTEQAFIDKLENKKKVESNVNLVILENSPILPESTLKKNWADLKLVPTFQSMDRSEILLDLLDPSLKRNTLYALQNSSNEPLELQLYTIEESYYKSFTITLKPNSITFIDPKAKLNYVMIKLKRGKGFSLILKKFNEVDRFFSFKPINDKRVMMDSKQFKDFDFGYLTEAWEKGDLWEKVKALEKGNLTK